MRRSNTSRRTKRSEVPRRSAACSTVNSVSNSDSLPYLEGHLEELYGEVRTGRFSTIIGCRYDPDSRQVLSSERVTPLYRADSRG
jgi:hypothetical protein